MALLNIITGADNPILRKKSEEISRSGRGFEKDLKKFVKDMKETMLAKDGLGLAAPQVGENVRMVIVTLGYGSKEVRVVTMINPEILEFSDEREVKEEGCLSLPGQWGKVERAVGLRLRFSDLEGNEQVLALSGLDARVVQHEVDHLDGVMFVDKLVVGKGEMV